MEKEHKPARSVNRRTFVSAATFAALMAFLPAPLRPRPAVAARTPIGWLWSNRSSARLVGARYLAQAPEDRELAWLLVRLLGDPDTICTRAPEALRCDLARKRESEFARGDTVILDGWILSRTEARLCALVALLDSHGNRP